MSNLNEIVTLRPTADGRIPRNLLRRSLDLRVYTQQMFSVVHPAIFLGFSLAVATDLPARYFPYVNYP